MPAKGGIYAAFGTVSDSVRFESVTFTKNRIDTILIINKNVSPDDEENLRTFF